MKPARPSTRRDFLRAAAIAVPATTLAHLAFGADPAPGNASPATPQHGSLQVTRLCDGLLRVRHLRSGAATPSVNERAGLVVPGAVREPTAAGLEAQTLSADPLSWQLLSPQGAPLGLFTLVPKPAGGFTLRATSRAQDGWYGLGFHRQKIELHGLTMRWERRFRHKEATVPFFFSTAGYGVFSNVPWSQTFDFAQPGQWSLEADQGDADVFLIFGPSPKQILDSYTRLCGRPQLPPRWALDPLFICRYFEPQAGVEEIARTFRARDIPCGMIGLEPGWEDVPYAMKWNWSAKRFPDPRAMIARLHAQGFRLEIWESGAAPDAGFADPAVRDAWFRARISHSLDLGVDFFKQDDPYPRGIVSEELQPGVERQGAPRTGPDAEVFNIANSLYSETAIRQMEQHRGQRGMLIFNSYFASVAAHRWPTAWAADFPSGTGLINASLSGHGMVSRDMDGLTLEGIHYGYLTPFSILDAWAYYKEPWLFPPHIEAAHRFYAKLRVRLGPHLYSAAWASHVSGVPMMRPMLIEHPEDPATREISSQHYFGDGLLVAQGSRTYLPAGRWVNYWTGSVTASRGEWHETSWAEPAGGPLWVRAGSIIVTKPVTAHVSAEEDSVLIAEVFPGDRATTSTLYEDDGVSLAYREGRCRRTELSCHLDAGSAAVTIRTLADTLRKGDAPRGFLVKMHTEFVPAEVTWRGAALPERASFASLVHTAGVSGWCRDAHQSYVWIKVEPQWHFGSDVRGDGDPERDTPQWQRATPDVDGHLQVRFGSKALPPRPPPPAAPAPADHLRLLLNPPERVALRDGRWLKHESTAYVWLEAAGRPTSSEEVEVQLEVRDAGGQLLRTLTQRTVQGRTAFERQAYVPGETTFQARAGQLRSEQARVRPTPPI